MVVIFKNCSHVLLIGANHVTQINLALKVNVFLYLKPSLFISVWIACIKMKTEKEKTKIAAQTRETVV